MGRCFAKHSMTSSKVCSSVRTGAIAGVFTYATSKQMLSMVGGSLNLRRLKFKAIRDGIPLWRKVFDLLIMGRTVCGRATFAALHLNSDLAVLVRLNWIK